MVGEEADVHDRLLHHQPAARHLGVVAALKKGEVLVCMENREIKEPNYIELFSLRPARNSARPSSSSDSSSSSYSVGSLGPTTFLAARHELLVEADVVVVAVARVVVAAVVAV